MKHLQEFLPAIDRIAVLGGGAWGTALAATAARAGT
jgi:glycerol-3-phosphate dehydrogenase